LIVPDAILFMFFSFFAYTSMPHDPKRVKPVTRCVKSSLASVTCIHTNDTRKAETNNKQGHRAAAQLIQHMSNNTQTQHRIHHSCIEPRQKFRGS
jgi:hypothetical protein